MANSMTPDLIRLLQFPWRSSGIRAMKRYGQAFLKDCLRWAALFTEATRGLQTGNGSRSAQPRQKKRPSEPSAPRDDDQDKPPVLRRPGSGGSEPPKPTPPVSPPADTPAATAPEPSPAATPAAPEQSGQDNDNDKDRPVLRRGNQPSPST